MVSRVSVQPAGLHRDLQRRRFSTAEKAKRQAQRAWSRSQIGHRSSYSVERLLAFRDYYQRTSFARVLAVCSLTPIPALFVTIAIDLIPLRPPSEGWNENFAVWFRLFISTFAISLGLIAQVKEVIVAQTISNIGAFKIAIATSVVYVGTTIAVAVSWRFPIPFGYVLMVGPYVSIFSFFTVLEIGPRILAQSLILRQQIKSQLQIVATQGVVAVAYPLFSAVFNRLTGVEQTAFVIVMPLIKFITKQIIANAAQSLDEYVGPIVVFSVDVFNVFYVAICMQAATSTVTTLLIIAADSFHVIVALRSIFQRKYDAHPHGRALSYYLNQLPIMVLMICCESESARRHIRKIY
ncbi:Hypothetical protein PHPALM_20400 [Phytophthora palmivora]|uniref:Uncharacterized protein n=1 Tax=Phytophthora palmivora TaxID=4796 RepID=A0A2P4XEZ8_9STRA|nr:Hypothetical protein PHPALM_20400 [Phytophthora palmivora]